MARSGEFDDQAGQGPERTKPLGWLVPTTLVTLLLGLAGLVALKLWVFIRLLFR